MTRTGRPASRRAGRLVALSAIRRRGSSGPCRRRRATARAPCGRHARRERRERHARTRPPVLPLDLLSRTERRAFRVGFHASWLHRGRTARLAWPRAQAAARRRSTPRADRGAPAGGAQLMVTPGAPLGTGHVVVIMVHGRNASPGKILTVAPEFATPRVTFMVPEAAGGSWYPTGFMAPTAENEPGITNGIAAVHACIDAHRRRLRAHSGVSRLQRCRLAHSRRARARERGARRGDERPCHDAALRGNGTPRGRLRARLDARAAPHARRMARAIGPLRAPWPAGARPRPRWEALWRARSTATGRSG